MFERPRNETTYETAYYFNFKDGHRYPSTKPFIDRATFLALVKTHGTMLLIERKLTVTRRIGDRIWVNTSTTIIKGAQ